MLSISHKFLYTLVRTILGGRLRFFLRLPLCYLVREFRPAFSGMAKRCRRETILALNPERFRRDLYILARFGNFRILEFPFRWQARLFTVFYGFSYQRVSDFYSPLEGSPIYFQRQAYREFLLWLMPLIFKREGISAVIGAAIHYKQDIDIGAVSDAIGVPYIVLHKENMNITEIQQTAQIAKCKIMGEFAGSHIFTHNEATRNCFVQSGYAVNTKVSALGSMRADEFLHAARKFPFSNVKRQVVLFSFSPGVGIRSVDSFVSGKNINWPKLGEKGFHRLFSEVHGAFGELAAENPDVNFVIKTKSSGDYTGRIGEALDETGLDWRSFRNLEIPTNADPNELIFSSKVVCAFNSTTLLEAAIIGKPVIYPMFAEAVDPEYLPNIYFKEDDVNAFVTCANRADLKRQLIACLENPIMNLRNLQAAQILYEQYVSSMDRQATQRYVEKIEEILAGRVLKL